MKRNDARMITLFPISTASTPARTTTTIRKFLSVSFGIAVAFLLLSQMVVLNETSNLRSTNSNTSKYASAPPFEEHGQHDGLERNLYIKGPTERFLETTMVGGNMFTGAMFDIETKVDMVVETLSCNLSSINTLKMSVYTKPGSYKDHMLEPGRWTKVSEDNLYLIANGKGWLTTIPSELIRDIPLKAGATQAFYIHLDLPRLMYTSGDQFDANVEMGDVFVQNNELAIRSGIGLGPMMQFDGSVTTPPKFVAHHGIVNKMWNGRIHYRLALDESKFVYTPSNFVHNSGNAATQGREFVEPGAEGLLDVESLVDLEGPTHSLTTPMAGGNYAYGIMFDVVALHNIRLQSLQVHLATEEEDKEEQFAGDGSDQMELKVYTMEGTHAGHEKYPTKWTLLCEVQVTAQGLGNMTEIPLGSFTPLNWVGGSRHALYITASRNVLQYTDGTLIHNLVVQNEHLMLLEGTGLGRKYFGGLFEPRKFNGGLTYQDLGEGPSPDLGEGPSPDLGEGPSPDFSAVDEYLAYLGNSRNVEDGTPSDSPEKMLVASDMIGANGSFGSMVDVVVKENDAIRITGLNIHTKIRDKDVMVRVYTKEGSHVGFEQDWGDGENSVWTLVLPPTIVKGAGVNLQTPLPNFVAGGIYVEAGATQAFLVMLDTAELRYDVGGSYSSGTDADANANPTAVESEDAYIKILEGTGLGRDGQYFTPRLFNGAVRYTYSVAPAASEPIKPLFATP
jgi:hypothetical protein